MASAVASYDKSGLIYMIMMMNSRLNTQIVNITLRQILNFISKIIFI